MKKYIRAIMATAITLLCFSAPAIGIGIQAKIIDGNGFSAMGSYGTVAPMPEPILMAMLGIGMLSLAGMVRRSAKSLISPSA